MKFSEVVAQTLSWLQRDGRVSYRALKLEFDLNDDMLDALKEEIIEAKRLAIDENGKVLVWIGAAPVQSSKPVLPAPVPQAQVSPVEGFQAPSSQLSVSSPQSLVPSTQSPAAERRQLTVMFCDLVGSTALSERLDPEELREVVRLYQETCTTVIQRYAGHIAQHLGDGLLVYFSYPTAHEDDAQRAVRTGVEILAALVPLNVQLSSTIKAQLPHPVQVRIGLHTGLVVIGEIGSSEKRELLALGETPNLAARIQGQANPNEVVISATTYRLVEGLFGCEDRGQPTLKGISTPLSLYRVVRENAAQSRFEAAVSKGLTPLVGREEELGLLRRRWEQAKASEGQVVLLSGEPGIGKSRLVQALKEQVMAEGATRIEFRCSAYHQNSAFYPIIEHLQRLLQFEREDLPQAKLTKLQQALAARRFPQTDTLPLLATLLSLPQPEDASPLTLSPQKQKQKIQEALVAWLVEEAEKAAVYCAWEDLHWADPSTLEVLTLFLEQIPTTRMFAILTFRPEFIPPWSARSYLTQLTLSRLGRSHVESMIEKVAGEKALPSEVLQQIVAKTDGVPLFVEELTKSVLESVGSTESVESERRSGQSSLQLGVPATLQDALMARLDRLNTAKEIAQLGAALGREFSYELLHAISSLDERTLQQGLQQLVEAELLYQRGLPPQATYLFKHALIQDTAYQSLLKSKRQQYHQQIAQVLEEEFSETKETQPELLAHHYTEAGLIAQAIPYWQHAGENALRRSAYQEVIALLTRGQELLKTLPDTPERIEQELTLQIVLNDALVAVKGYAAPEVGKTMTLARDLCQQVGQTPQLFPVLWRLLLFYMNRWEFQTTREVAEQMMRLAQSAQDQYLLSVAYMCTGGTLYWCGELTPARAHMEQAIALYDPQKHPHSTVNTTDLRVDCLSYVARTLWYLGYPDQGLKRTHEAVALAEGLSYPFSLAYALGNAARFHLLRREELLARERAEALITLSTEQGFPFWLTLGTIVRGWALAEQGQVQEGIAQLRQIRQPFYLALLAETYGKVGQVEEGLSVVAEALVLVDKTGERISEAELYRLKGELTLQQLKIKNDELTITKAEIPHPNTQHLIISSAQTEAEAEACFHRAIDIARKQEAKSLELRATTSLAHLWQRQGKRTEAHHMLLEVYNWFTEGFDTKDLQEAKMLLDELG